MWKQIFNPEAGAMLENLNCLPTLSQLYGKKN
jgi:hypothetical protein